MSLDAAWNALLTAADGCRAVRIAELFDREPDRLSRLRVEVEGLTLDLSKQSWTLGAFDAALDLARAAGVEPWRERMFAGERINGSEDRAVLHVALRARPDDGFDPEVEAMRRRMKAFAETVRREGFEAILHIGIGGSDLGPRLVWDALRPLASDIDLRFVANVDPDEFAFATAGLDPATTLVVVVSKTFGTQETLANAALARAWLGEDRVASHMAAVSTALDRTTAFGIAPDRVFGFWDWVGGRYSLWSAVGLSVAAALGWDRFEALLGGARAMDGHFRSAPLERNAPVLLALAQVFNRNGLDRRARSVAPYAHRLRRLPSFLQQLEMESNGKGVDRHGRPAGRQTCPVVFGGEGTNVQHAYFQQMHQGTDVVPLEFLAVADGDRKLNANAVAQAEALLIGRDDPALPPEKRFEGNRPSTTILIDSLSPHRLGALLALYEHKTFVEGVIWNINSFDQWGVELGKSLAGRILPEIEGGAAGEHDPSTTALIERLRG